VTTKLTESKNLNLDDFCKPNAPAVAVDPVLEDLCLRAVAKTERNHAAVTEGLRHPRLAGCALCARRAEGIGVFVPKRQPTAEQVRVAFYGYCTACQGRADFQARVEAKISAGEPFGHSVDLEQNSEMMPTVEQAEFLNQFNDPEMRARVEEIVRHPAEYGFDMCGLCRVRPMAIFGFFNPGIKERDGLDSQFLYALCKECYYSGGHEQMVAQALERMASRGSIFPRREGDGGVPN
jgi:hypothetical protein